MTAQEGNLVTPVQEFAFEDKWKMKDAIAAYETSIQEPDKWILMDIRTSGGFIRRETEQYVKNTSGTGNLLYYGKLDRSGRATGAGVLFALRDDFGLTYDSDDLEEIEQENVYENYVYPKYIGRFSDGKIQGYGASFTVYDGFLLIEYEGEWKNGIEHGKGTDYIVSSQFYNQKDGISVGISEENGISLINGAAQTTPVYKGNYKNGEMEGDGKEYSWDGILIYDGSFKSGEYSGKGILYYDDGKKRYEGSFKGGEYNGKGTLYDEDGSVKFKGEFSNGEIK